MARWPARCNRRDCQARRNLSKHPSEYVTWPTCHRCHRGRMYVDNYRKRKGPRDHPPVCRDPFCQHGENTRKVVPYHRVSTKGCSGYDAYVTERNRRLRSKHSPIPASEWVPF